MNFYVPFPTYTSKFSYEIMWNYSYKNDSLLFRNNLSLTSNLEHLFNLKFAVKELERNAKKCEKEEIAEKAKTKKAIQKGNMDVARIHAENAIRQKNQSLNYLRMSARVDAVASRVQSALTTRKVNIFFILII